MLLQRYKSLEDLWCEWPEATSAIMKHFEVYETLPSNSQWGFDEGIVVKHHRNGYSVSVIHHAYDTAISHMVCLSVQAIVNNDGVSVKTLKRAKLGTES